jgi:hypothetical protein
LLLLGAVVGEVMAAVVLVDCLLDLELLLVPVLHIL